MNKTEKLLAARKRLKEFQLSKKNPAPREQTENTVAAVDASPLNSEIDLTDRTESPQKENHDHQSFEPPATISETQNATEFYENFESAPGDTSLIDLSSPNRFFQDTTDFSQKRIADEEPGVLSGFTRVEEKENPLILENQNTPDVSNGVYDTQTEVSTNNEEEQVPNNDYTTLLGSQAMQKEYLMQMTSAVNSALIDDLESKVEPHEVAADLEERNRFLAASLQEQKETVNRLHVEVSQYKSRVSQLEGIIATKDTEFEGRLYRELNPLKDQLQLHAQTTGILVGEKAELTAALMQSQTTVRQKVSEVEELNGKLRSMQNQIYELERELNSVRNNSNDAGKINQQIQSNYEILEKKYFELKQEKDDLDLETAELKQKLNVKNTELTQIQQELKEKTALLSLNELRMQQMTSSTQESQGLGEQHHVVAALEQQLSQLMETLKSVSSERDEASSHYQNYVQQLNAQVTTLAQKLEQTMKENAEISSREHSLIQRLSDLECQIQSHQPLPEPAPTVVNDNKEEIEALEKSIEQLTVERETLRTIIHEKDSNLDSLRREIEELQEMRNSNAEASRLASAMEGERLAAARAVSQNQQLKQQLSEMQDAFVQLSNDKLDLTEKLQGERSIGKKLNARLNDTENDVDKLKEEIQRKDSLLAELEKEKLHAAQIADQMQHYQAQSHNASTLQQELHSAQERIEILTKQNQQLINELSAAKSNQSTEQVETVEIEDKPETVNNIPEYEAEISTAATQTESHGDTEPVTVATGQDIAPITPEAVRKLEERFKDTMERVAELSDEKQRLEHLVLQLQSETETIGEYVTLYQKQRSVLQERAKEKEEAFRILTEQRNQQQEQLHKLKMLVAELIKEKNIGNAATAPPYDMNGGDPEATDHPEVETPDRVEAVVVKDKTTSQILDLLTEIKECKDTCASEPNFHPCPWCSGKLITV